MAIHSAYNNSHRAMRIGVDAVDSFGAAVGIPDAAGEIPAIKRFVMNGRFDIKNANNRHRNAACFGFMVSTPKLNYKLP